MEIEEVYFSLYVYLRGNNFLLKYWSILCDFVCVYVYLTMINITKPFNLDSMQKAVNIPLLFQDYF